jgi:hypothetical protein
MNTLSITISELRTNRACDLDDRIAALSAHLGRTPEDDEPVPLSVWAEVTPEVDDLVWALRCCWARGGRAVGVEVACRAADRAMVHARPGDVPVLRAAVDAARGCVAGTVTVEACRAAADAAYADADAYAAYAADAAADAAAAAADADAAAYAAERAACAAAAERATERAAQRADLLGLLVFHGDAVVE